MSLNKMFKLLDQVDRPGQEEFIWAMRMRTIDQSGEDDVWRERRLKTMTLFGDSRRTSSQSSLQSEQYPETKTRIIASLLPDEVIVDPTNYNVRLYEAAVVRGRIIGLMPLFEKYRTIVKGGQLGISKVLNNFLGGVMQEAFAYNGDVISYTGNHFICMWKQGKASLSDCAHQAMDFSLSLIKGYANFEADHGVKLDIQIGIACGTLIFSLLGNQKASSYLVLGKPIEEITEMMRKMGDNKLHVNSSVVDNLNINEYICNELDDEPGQFNVLDFSSAWRSIQVVNKDKTSTFYKSTDISVTSLSQLLVVHRGLHDVYELRPCIGDAINMNTYDLYKRFIYPPLLHTVEVGEPIENLSEMRHMVIMAASFNLEAQAYSDIMKLADMFYRMINNIVEPYSGYVNRIVFGDNELTMYILFGIRGKKHELESRNALIAATKCFKGSENTAFLSYCSMAVVTGVVFCGPIGHYLRRDYAVIGTNIVKARSLVADFPNKVTCDRETFLQSKLEARHFVLQEYKQVQDTALKLGPIYEYIEFDMSNRLPKYHLNKFPLLDREFEIETFKSMLIQEGMQHPDIDKFISLYTPSGLFILGEARQGKTRLIEECISLTPGEMLMFRLRLCAQDKAIPFQAIYFLFGVPLGIAENSTTLDRETKLMSKLQQLPLEGLECLLNVVFRVNFPRSLIFEALTPRERLAVLKNIIKHLCRVCFVRPWVIFIDGGEYIDNESWDLIYPILETHSVLLVAAIGCAMEELPPNARDVISFTKSRCIKLLPIDKLYHSALACQMLDCIAIPVELEKVLQDKSQGNPGWMENFLLSLVHSNVIWIRKITAFTDYKDKLVVPQRDNLIRKAHVQNPQVTPRTKSTLHRAIVMNREKWSVFSTVDTATDEIADLEEAAKLITVPQFETTTLGRPSEKIPSTHSQRDSAFSMHAKSKSKAVMTNSMLDSLISSDKTRIISVEVCLVAPGGENLLASYDTEFFSTYYVTKIMDTMSSFELSFLKCASVIGDYFLRENVFYLMLTSNDRKFAFACKRLFEMGVIACAEGDFRKSIMNYAPLMTDHYKSFDEINLQCNCVGFLVSDSCRDLPHYANCGFMRFKKLEFRQAAYNLLTHDQLVNMHMRALRYLEKRTRKCVSCGGGGFTRILGNHYEEGVLAQRRLKRATMGTTVGKSSASLLEDWEYLGQTSGTSFSRFSRSKSRGELTRVDSSSIFYQFTKAGVANEARNEVPPFDQYDFTCCECDKILRCLYYYIRKHYEMTEQYEKWMYATLEYAVLCIEDFNVALALKYLNNALEILNGPYKTVVKPGETWKYGVVKARILAEIGRANSELGQTKLAYIAYEEALQCYGYRLPKSSSLRFKLMEFRQYILLALKSRYGIGVKYGYIAEFCDNVSHCLSMMTTLFVNLGMWDNAYIAAMWSLRKALQSEKNFITLINAFDKMIYISGRMKKYTISDSLELMALDYCRRYRCSVDIYDLRSVAYLYSSIFYTRIQRAHFEEALNVGFSLDNLTDMLHLRQLLIQLFPLFFEILLIRMEGINILNALTTYQQITLDCGYYIGDVWFYSLCIYFHLQTGYMYENIRTCEEYYYTQFKRIRSFREPEAERRYFVAIWLWYIRTENYEQADIWEQKLPKEWPVDRHESINNLITTLMYIEGLILLVTFKMDRKVIFVIERMYDKIGELIRKMELLAAKVKIIAPRLYHLKAYFAMCKMKEYDASDILDKSIRLAQATDNQYDEGWAEHSKRAWEHSMSSVEFSCWKDHAGYDVLDFHEMESNNYKITYYTLELPLYL